MATLELIIKATDQASGVFRTVEGAIGGIGKVALGVGAAGIGAIGAGLALSVKEAMAAQEAQAQLNAVLQSTGGVAGVTAEMANNLATSLSGVTRFSDDTILAGQNLLLTFTGIGKDVFPDATKVMLDMATAMKTDATGAAMQLGKALNNPAEGLSALTRVGVTFTEEQERQVEALMASGETAKAQAIILAELQKEFSGSAEAAGKTFAGQLDILKNRLGNVAESIGTAVLPILQQLFDGVIAPALPLIEELAAVFGGFIESVAAGDWQQGFDALGESELFRNFMDLIGMTGDQLYNLEGTLRTLGGNVMAYLQPLIDAGQNLAAAFMESLPMIQTYVADMVAFVRGLIAQFGPTILANVTATLNTLAEFWRAHGDEVMAVVNFLWRTLAATVGGALTLITGLISAAVTTITGLWAAVSAALQGDWAGAWEAIQSAGLAAWETIKATFASFMEGVLSIVGLDLASFTETWSTNWEMAKTIVVTLWDNIKTAIADKLMEITSGIQTRIIETVDTIRGFVGRFVEVGQAIIDGLKQGIENAAGGLIAAATGAVQSAIDAAKALLGIHSPSAVFAEMGRQMMAGMSKGIQGAVSVPPLALAGSIPGVVGGLAGPGALRPGRFGAEPGAELGNVTVNLTVAPAIMFGNEYEAGLKLRRYVRDALSELGIR